MIYKRTVNKRLKKPSKKSKTIKYIRLLCFFGSCVNGGATKCWQPALHRLVFAQQETHLIGFSFQNHTAEITEVPIVMLRAHKGEGKSILYGDLFANYSIFCVDTVCAKRGEHLKSHMKNSYDCHHGVWFCGVLTE